MRRRNRGKKIVKLISTRKDPKIDRHESIRGKSMEYEAPVNEKDPF